MVYVLQKFVFFVVIVLYCIARATSLHCLRNEFKCRNEDKCIHELYRCDGIPDCYDNSDEQKCGDRHCTYSDHRCNNACWRRTRIVCDGKIDCSDGSDEKNCRNSTCKVNEFLCKNSKCIPMALRYNGIYDCSDGTDEEYCEPCPEGQLSCDSGKCIRREFFCDGRENCPDGSDEKDCGYEDSDIFFLNEGPHIYIKKKTKAGLEFTHLLPISFQMKRTGVHNGMKITGLGFDVRNQNLFISDAGGPAIFAVNVTSSEWRYLVNNRISSPMDIAFDYTGNNLYWVDFGSGTAEVVSVDTRKRTVIIRDLSNPVSLALSPNTGTMFIATTAFETCVFMYGMDGSNRRILNSIQGSPASLALHPTKSLLFWTDPEEGTISYVNYTSSSLLKILKKKINGVMAVTVTDRDIYFTSGEPVSTERAHRIKIPGYEKDEGWKSITVGMKPYSGKSECHLENGGCDYLCLTSEIGRTCACPSEKTLGEDGKSCLD